jgi:hypothetical protein
MKRYTTKLCSESSVEPFKMNHFVLVVQLVVMSENIHSRMTSARSNNPEKPANLNDSIPCQLMQLYLKLAKYPEGPGAEAYEDQQQRNL